MTALETYSCSNCVASDWERLCACWIGLEMKINHLSNKSLTIHFAPEATLSSKLRALHLTGYHTADLMMDGCDYKIDMMDMPFDDEFMIFYLQPCVRACRIRR
jgi:hypothetical protein